MNPRVYCREQGYPRAVALTYSFDPLFFERIVLRDLWAGGTTDITVIGDRNELQSVVERCAGQLIYLGKKYLTASAETRGAFHPKLLLRIGPTGAILLTGSGNLTFGGWGANNELSVALELRAENPESAALVNYLLDSITRYVSSEAVLDSLARLRDYPWLSADTSASSHNIFVTRPDQPLSDLLQQRWQGRRFTKLMAFTGSTDERGAFVEWCHRQFGIQECTIAVTPDNCSFDANLTSKLPVEITVAPFKGHQMLHAKFFWFDGPDGPAAIMGSANCSAAAWLIPPRIGGNVEIVRIYDYAEAADFEAVLARFPEERITVTAKAAQDTEEPKDQEHPYFATLITLRRNQFLVEVQLNKAVPLNGSITLLRDDDKKLALELSASGVWYGRYDELLTWPDTTSLATLEISIGSDVIITPPHWIDDVDSITTAAQAARITNTFNGLWKSRTPSEYDRVVSDLANIATALFMESSTFHDPRPQLAGRDHGEDTTASAGPVKPEDLLKSLDEIEIKAPNAVHSSSGGGHFSLFGIMRALFGENEPVLQQGIATPDPGGDPLGGEAPENPPKAPQKPPREHEPVPPPPEKYRRRLKEQLESFLVKLTDERFVAECTATRLVQSAAFPLAVALFGEKGEWLTHEEARVVVTRVVDELMFVQKSAAGCFGLLDTVAKRYENNGQIDVFRTVVGDGTLWVALISALAHVKWETSFDRFVRAVSLTRLTKYELLRSDVTLGKLGSLLSRVQVESAREIISREAPVLVAAVDQLEADLASNYKEYLDKQKSVQHRIGDVLWQPTAGWGIVKCPESEKKIEAYLHLRGEQKKVVAHGFFVNVTQMSDNVPMMRECLQVLT